jgi:hypothetical protein
VVGPLLLARWAANRVYFMTGDDSCIDDSGVCADIDKLFGSGCYKDYLVDGVSVTSQERDLSEVIFLTFKKQVADVIGSNVFYINHGCSVIGRIICEGFSIHAHSGSIFHFVGNDDYYKLSDSGLMHWKRSIAKEMMGFVPNNELLLLGFTKNISD